MTTLFLAMLAIIIIIAIARYYGSPKLANNLLITLALSVVVGLGFKYLQHKSEVKKETKTEIVDSNMPMQSVVDNNTTDYGIVSTTCLTGTAGKDNTCYYYNNGGLQQRPSNPLINLDIGCLDHLDSS